jgi:uncharacterized protein YkwD
MLAAVAPLTSETIRPAEAATCYKYKDSERGFARKTNLARDAAGVRKLRLDPQLSKVARKHAHEMADKNRLHHTPWDTLKRRVTNWRILGENVGYGSSVTSLHRAFMDSKVHRDNILHSSYRYIGVGVVNKHGYMWVTVVFEGYDNPGTRLNMPSC